jgi:co-chaperonin GroES (HSP10)
MMKRNNHAAFKRYARQHNKKAAPHRIAIGDRVLVKNVITKKKEYQEKYLLYGQGHMKL